MTFCLRYQVVLFSSFTTHNRIVFSLAVEATVSPFGEKQRPPTALDEQLKPIMAGLGVEFEKNYKNDANAQPAACEAWRSWLGKTVAEGMGKRDDLKALRRIL